MFTTPLGSVTSKRSTLRILNTWSSIPTPANFNALLGRTLGESVIPCNNTFLPIVSVILLPSGICVPVPKFNALPNDSVARPPHNASAPEPV